MPTTAQQRIEATLGNLIVQNAALSEANEALTAKVGDLEKQLSDANEKLAKPQASAA